MPQKLFVADIFSETNALLFFLNLKDLLDLKSVCCVGWRMSIMHVFDQKLISTAIRV